MKKILFYAFLLNIITYTNLIFSSNARTELENYNFIKSNPTFQRWQATWAAEDRMNNYNASIAAFYQSLRQYEAANMRALQPGELFNMYESPRHNLPLEIPLIDRIPIQAGLTPAPLIFPSEYKLPHLDFLK